MDNNDNAIEVIIMEDDDQLRRKLKKEKKREKKKRQEEMNAIADTTNNNDDDDDDGHHLSSNNKKIKQDNHNIEPTETEDIYVDDEQQQELLLQKQQRKLERKLLKKNKKLRQGQEEQTEQLQQQQPTTSNPTTTTLPSSPSSSSSSSPLSTFPLAKSHFPPQFGPIFDTITRNFDQPTEIQARVWGLLLAGHDVVGIASTGSGKTLAFTLPAISRMLSSTSSPGTTKSTPNHNNKKFSSSSSHYHRGTSPFALILSPTRELCLQNFQVVKTCCDATSGAITPCVVYGGQPRIEQQKILSKGNVDFLIATPGRLLDFIESNEVNLSSCEFMVLDEADRMLDMGFEKDVRRILSCASNKSRQTLMFSATWPIEIRSIANEFLKKDYIKVVVGSENLKAASTVEQIVMVMEPQDKDKQLLQILQQRHNNNRVIVFALYKKEAERLERMLQQRRFSVVGAHGDKSQHHREASVKAFTDGDALILVATDVASRGLDIKGVELVINYTFPLTIEDYVHRIGRTGRAGKTGTAITFFTSLDKLRAGELQNVLREAGATIPNELKAFGGTVKKKEHAMYGSHYKIVDSSSSNNNNSSAAAAGDASAKRVTFSDSDDE
jgi:ATP-dependent RNA helicase DBP3